MTPQTPEGAKLLSTESFGLRRHALSPVETLAQSVSTIAPSTSPQLTVPLVFALAGQGTALAYLVAMGLMVLVGLCIAAFARESSSPGSLFVYTRRSLPPAFSAVTAWALFFAYIATAAAVIGGFVQFAYIFLEPLRPHGLPHVPAVLLVAIAALVAGWVAYHDVKVSARLMLYIEGASVCLIAVVIAALLLRHGLHFDHPQLHRAALHPRGIGLGVMLAIFSFVGFESATTLGAEARDPLRTIPRAVIQSALLAGVFFILCAYGEVLGFRSSATSLDASPNPFRFLSAQAGLPLLGPCIDAGVLISMFAATLACVIAASRVLLLMAHHRLISARLTHTHATHETPGLASVLAALFAFLPAAALALHGTSGADIYGWMGTLSVYGFLTAYGLVAVALFARHVKIPHGFSIGPESLATDQLPQNFSIGPESAATDQVPQGFSLGSHVAVRKWGALAPRERYRIIGIVLLTGAATLAMLLAMASNLYPVPPAPLNFFPYLYAAYLTAALLWLWSHRKSNP